MGEGDDAAPAEGGDGEEKKEEKKGFMAKFSNPFSKDEDPNAAKKKEQAKLLKEQQAREESETKKRKEETDRKKVEREEVEENQRLQAKKEKYQRLLQKAPDLSKRVFQFRMRAIKFQSLSQDPLPGLYLKVYI